MREKAASQSEEAPHVHAGLPIIRFHVLQAYDPMHIRCSWTADTRPLIPEIETEIERVWDAEKKRPGINLFDGPMCRLESFSVGEFLELHLSKTSYRIFLGTNLHNSHFADRFGSQSLANPVGLSCAVETSDGFVMLGRRNASVAHYPNRVHPFAGTLEPHEAMDIFSGVRRELREELQFTESDIARIVCLGIAEDISVRQPEFIFHVQSNRTRKEIEQTLDATEHTECFSVAAKPDAVAKMVFANSQLLPRILPSPATPEEGNVGWARPTTNPEEVGRAHPTKDFASPHPNSLQQTCGQQYRAREPEENAVLTPIAAASLLMLGRERFGDSWFAAANRGFVATPSGASG